jgi:plasmid stabilization system protein ParE
MLVISLTIASALKRSPNGEPARISPGLRIVGFHRKATIAFEVADDTVIILRVFHRGRNVDFDPDTDNE